MEKTTLYIAGDVHRRLQELAKREKRPQAQLIREALAEYIAARSAPWPSSAGLGEDGEIRGSQVKDWLRSHWQPR